jgi:3-oxocholest-4-en-26-oyl-CoA dehydrogenase alpha subunit
VEVPAVHIATTGEQEQLRAELRAYFADLVTPELRAESRATEGGGPLCKEAVRRLGRDGWLGIGWPKEFGGQGRSAHEQYIFFEEAWRQQAPIPYLTVNSVGPAIMAYGSEEQKRDFLPRILAGEVWFAIGYSEPGAGTDLAGLTTRAVRDGDEYVIDGAKTWTSQAHFSDYLWLAVRTDPDAPKHKGLSILIVPTDSPGVSFTPIHLVGGNRVNATHLDGVRVPVDNVVLGENRGWTLITSQLNHERFTIAPAGFRLRVHEDVLRWAATTRLDDGTAVIDLPWVRQALARIRSRLEVLRLMNWRLADQIHHDALEPAQASALKVFATETALDDWRLLLEIVGQVGYLVPGSPDAELHGMLEHQYRNDIILTYGGGTSEIQRDIIAMAGLGMPRAPR